VKEAYSCAEKARALVAALSRQQPLNPAGCKGKEKPCAVVIKKIITKNKK